MRAASAREQRLRTERRRGQRRREWAAGHRL